VHRAGKIFQVQKAERKIIDIDETKIKINAKWCILWAAVDVENWDVLGVWITQKRSSFEAYSFIRHVLQLYENKPKILVDDEPWYPLVSDQIKRRIGTHHLQSAKSY